MSSRDVGEAREQPGNHVLFGAAAREIGEVLESFVRIARGDADVRGLQELPVV